MDPNTTPKKNAFFFIRVLSKTISSEDVSLCLARTRERERKKKREESLAFSIRNENAKNENAKKKMSFSHHHRVEAKATFVGVRRSRFFTSPSLGNTQRLGVRGVGDSSSLSLSSSSARRKSAKTVDADEGASKTTTTTTTTTKKEAVLRRIASSRKDDTIETREKKREILEAISALEKEALVSSRRRRMILDANDDAKKISSIEGRWSLVYSTSDDENKAMFALDDANDKIVKDILDALYAFFFAFAAPFAGGFQSETYKKKGRGGEVFIKSIRNEQIVDLKNGRVENLVDVEILGRETRVVVRGEIKLLDKNQEKVQVTFTDWSFGDVVTLPLPRPTGGLENTYCDETMRISRGSRGGVFITTRIGRDTPQK